MNEPASRGSRYADRRAAERALAMALPLIEPQRWLDATRSKQLFA